jgi:outer membrane translocation and assembly module TamA
MAFVPCAFGQLPKRLEKCLPYPTLAQEIKAAQPAEHAPTQVKLHVVRVDFSPDDGIPADAQEEISTELQKQVLERDADSAYLKNLGDEIAELGVKGALRDRGYFKAAATAKLTPLEGEGTDISVVVAIRGTLGSLYRTGDIQIESTDSHSPLIVSPEILRGLISLQGGEPFSTKRVRNGLDNLARVYGRQGYIDMTPEPETYVDDERKIIDLVIKIDQQVQYRVGSIEFLGINNATREKLVESLPKPGEVFDKTRLNEFFTKTMALLLPDASENDMSVTRDAKTKTVAILFDFRECPSNSN